MTRLYLLPLLLFLLSATACQSDSSDPAPTLPSPEAPAPAEDVASGEDGVEYTCPMHPEIVSATEGRCPTCNMFLVPGGEAVQPPEGAHGDGHEAHHPEGAETPEKAEGAAESHKTEG